MPLPGEVPVTIITGFLGAGKTTLLNHILKEKGARNLAVIENEFGEVNIDKELVAENLVEKEDLVSLQNGCVCCSLRKDIVRAFAEIERRNRQRHQLPNGRKVDHVVLETTGLADPAPVAFTFFANPWIASRFRLDSIICVVDARYLMQHLEDAHHVEGTVNEAVQQIAFADLILLNKVDLVDEEQMEKVTDAIREINRTAQVIDCQLNDEGGRPPIEKLLGNNLFSVKRKLQQDPFFLASDSDSELESEDEGLLQLPEPSETPEELPGPSCPGGAADAAAAGAEAGACGTSGAAAQGVAAAAGAAHADSRVHERSSSAGVAGPGPSSTSQQQASALLAKYHVGSKRPHEGVEGEAECQQERCGQCDGAAAPAQQRHHHHQQQQQPEQLSLAKAPRRVKRPERRPKRRAKRLHDLSDVSSVAITAHGPLDEYRFNMYMRDLLAEKAKDIFRCKGVLSVHGYGAQKFVFQGVHETICYGPAESKWKDGDARINQIVFIGRSLDRRELIEGFRSCVWVPLPEAWVEFRDAATNSPYYVNKATGEKAWKRPDEIACPRVLASQGPTQQPQRLLPKRSVSASLSSPMAVSAGGGAGPMGGAVAAVSS